MPIDKNIEFDIFEKAKMFGLVSLLGIVHLSHLKGKVVNGSEKARYIPSSAEKYIIKQISESAKRNYEIHKRNGNEEAAQKSLWRIEWTKKYFDNGHSE